MRELSSLGDSDARAAVTSRTARRPRTRVAVVAAVLAAMIAPVVSSNTSLPWFLCEFRGDLYNAGRDIARGRDPYRAAYIAHQAAVKRAGERPVTAFIVPVYPAPALVAAVPVSLLPFPAAGLLYLLLEIAALMAALRALGVTDLRCLGAMIASVPVLQALIDGALTPFLMLGAAAAWTQRERFWRSAVAVGSIVAAKLLLWPLLGWMLLTHRLRGLAASVTTALTLLLVGWASVGFAGMTGYPHMLSNLVYVEQSVGVSLVALLMAAGVSSSAAHPIVILAAAALLIAARLVYHRPDGARRAFGLTIIAALTASPIAWPNYLALVFVPIALASPRLSSLWFVPLLAYAAPATQTHGRLLEILPYVLIEAIIAGRLLWTIRLLPPVPGAARAQLTAHAA